jgi:hypothetical protein
MRTVKSKMVTDKIVQELSVINGFFNLMKSQYDFQMDYYSRELKQTEYQKIWNFIERHDEYINFMIPPDPNTASLIIYEKEKDHLKDLNYDNAIKTVNEEENENSKSETP